MDMFCNTNFKYLEIISEIALHVMHNLTAEVQFAVLRFLITIIIVFSAHKYFIDFF